MKVLKRVASVICLVASSYSCGFFDASSAPNWCWVVAFITALVSTFFVTMFMMGDGDGDG